MEEIMEVEAMAEATAAEAMVQHNSISSLFLLPIQFSITFQHRYLPLSSFHLIVGEDMVEKDMAEATDLRQQVTKTVRSETADLTQVMESANPVVTEHTQVHESFFFDTSPKVIIMG